MEQLSKELSLNQELFNSPVNSMISPATQPMSPYQIPIISDNPEFQKSITTSLMYFQKV